MSNTDDLAEARAKRKLEHDLRESIRMCSCGKYGWQHKPAEALRCLAETSKEGA